MSNISVTNVGQVAVINGTVASPDDAAQAEMLVSAALNPGVDVTKAGAPLEHRAGQPPQGRRRRFR